MKDSSFFVGSLSLDCGMGMDCPAVCHIICFFQQEIFPKNLHPFWQFLCLISRSTKTKKAFTTYFLMTGQRQENGEDDE